MVSILRDHFQHNGFHRGDIAETDLGDVEGTNHMCPTASRRIRSFEGAFPGGTQLAALQRHKQQAN